MLSVSPRLVTVQQAVQQLWETSGDGRWAALENALLEILTPKKKTPPRPETGLPRRPATNVIVLTPALVTRMRRKA